jgi:DNA-directed RNA polymerase specialized sigma24 family protein
VKPIVWLLGLVRGACATKLSKMPLRTRSPITTSPERSELQALPPTEREAVVLMLVGGLSAADVALACNVDEGTAKTRIARGLKQIQEGSR